jgi:hypothetical protein
MSVSWSRRPVFLEMCLGHHVLGTPIFGSGSHPFPIFIYLVRLLSMKEIQWAYDIFRATTNPSKITSSISAKMKSTMSKGRPVMTWRRSHYWRLVIDSALPIHGNIVFHCARWTKFASGVSMSGVRYARLPTNDSTKSLVISSSDGNDPLRKLRRGGSRPP